MGQHQELVHSLRQSGHRLTPQRESVLTVIAESQGHLTAEEILKRVRRRYPYLVKSAVYRSLDLLTEVGLVTQTDLGHGRVEYELHRHPHHHHLICRRCGLTVEIEATDVEQWAQRTAAMHGFRDAEHVVDVFGLCTPCAKAKARAEA